MVQINTGKGCHLEAAKVVVFSVTEGEDKPLEYPRMFRVADAVVISKTDLVPDLDFDLERALQCLQDVNPSAKILQLSSKSGEGMDAWYQSLASKAPQAQHGRSEAPA